LARYLVKARPKLERLAELRQSLDEGKISVMRPFGRALDYSLKNGRIRKDGYATWEEEDYCSPPLAQEREAVLDHHFEDLTAERIEEGDGWKRIEDLPSMWVSHH
jgi:hypothetical protein